MMDALARLREMQADDLALHGGRSLAYVYDAGREDLDAIVGEAVAMYSGANGLDPTAFPSLLAMENELVGFACDLVDAPDTAVGTVTTGGTESIMLAVQGARDARPDIERPNLVLPETAHPSFQKAAQYFGVEQVIVRVDGHYRALVGAMAEAMNADTVPAVASAPSYADRIGRVKPAWTFAVPGVSSISVDLHKYGYAPKGASILLHRTAAERRPTYFSSADWPGYTMVNTTMQSTRAGAPLAGAWATVQTIGDEGCASLARDCLEAVDLLLTGIDEIDGLELVVRPDSTLIAVRTDGSCDVFTIADEMSERGWYVGPQMSWRGEPPTLHLSVSAATLSHVEECLAALSESVAVARSTGPVRVDRSALFNAASPRLREALLETYIDRLYRPVRARFSDTVPT